MEHRPNAERDNPQKTQLQIIATKGVQTVANQGIRTVISKGVQAIATKGLRIHAHERAWGEFVSDKGSKTIATKGACPETTTGGSRDFIASKSTQIISAARRFGIIVTRGCTLLPTQDRPARRCCSRDCLTHLKHADTADVCSTRTHRGRQQ